MPSSCAHRPPECPEPSRFFREPNVLEALTGRALASRIHAASATEPLRVWVPACGAGEEVYTLAICLLEQFQGQGKMPRLQIFATDADDQALALTRAGCYAPSALAGLDRSCLERYFEPPKGRCRQARALLRNLLSTAVHDALRHPPIFSRLDLISARNLPAHLPREVARRFAASAQFALRTEGWLLLSTQADASAAREQFAVLGEDLPIYRKSPHNPRRTESPAEELEAAHSALSELNIQLNSLREERALLGMELQHNTRRLEAGNDDLAGLIDMLQATAVFLDPDLRIRRYAGGAEALLGLGQADLGRSLAALKSPLIDAALLAAVRHAAATGTLAQKEVRCVNQRWYLRRIQPHDLAGAADGVVITWVDITPIKSLQEEVARIAALEQQRIGQELHDGIQQELTALALLGQNLRDALAAGAAAGARERQWAAHLTEGIAVVNRHVQALARGLVPVPIDAPDLAPALARLARTTSEYAEVACEFTLEGTLRLPNADCATHLYHIAQEAVTNATRHARASRIHIRLSAQDGTVQLEIRDDGIGLPPAAGLGRGVGLRLMEHRCSLIGATLSARSDPAGGTRVACTLPAP